jgi:ATP-dependent RNA helicase DeaD
MRNIEHIIGKKFVEGEIPSSEEICKKQLYKAMDAILKTDVDEEQIEPFMADISRYFDYIDKEDLIKKIVTREFGQFLAYYADAPEIVKPSVREARGERGGKDGRRGKRGDREKASHAPEKGYKRLFINLGKKDGFYPGEIMQFINKHVRGHVEVGHIDILDRQAYIEVPEEEAPRVMRFLDGTVYKGRKVRCNDADEGRSKDEAPRAKGRGRTAKTTKSSSKPARTPKAFRTPQGDWRELMKGAPFKLKGEQPDFSEEGWARRKPRKK